MHVIRLGRTTYSLHIEGRTMFMIFKHHTHAQITEKAIRHFICTHHTLPPTYVNDNDGPLPLTNPHDWVHLLCDLYIDEIEDYELHTMCELCNAGYLYVEDMKEPNLADEKMKLSYVGDVYDGVDMKFEDVVRYLESLL